MSRFVGRRRELAELLSALEALAAGKGTLLLIAGEPGIGKTRLAEQAAEAAAGRGVAVAWGRCTELEGVPPYWPWVQVLREVRSLDPETLRLRDRPDAAAAIGRLLPELGSVPASRSRADATEQRFLLFEAVDQVLRAATAARPFVIVLDDLQWADAGSLALLRHLAGEIHLRRLLVVAAYRDVGLARRGPLAAALPELAREPAARRLRLRGLDVAEVAEYLAAAGESDPALARAVHEQAGGNPFYVGEIRRLMSVEGGVGTLPAGVRDILGRRLDHLSEECQQMLGAAAVLGREFDVELLAALRGVPADSLLPLIDEAEAADVLVRHGSPRTYAFAHDLVRECLYQELPTRARLQLHRDAAEMFERSDPPATLSELAHHWYEAGGEASWEKAVEYAERAAAAAMDQVAYEEAARLLGMALESLPAGSADQLHRWRILHDLSVARYRAGLMRDSLQSCVEAARVAAELRRGDLQARSVLVIQDVADSAVHPTLQALCESALSSIGDRHPALRAQLLAQLARILDTLGRPERNDVLSREAVELANLSRDPDSLVAAIHARHTVASLPGGIEERRRLGTSLVEISAAGGALSHAAWGHLWRIDAAFQSGDLASVPGEIADLEVAVDRLRQPLFRWHLLRTQAALAQVTGRFEEALDLNDRALEAWGPAHHPMTGVFHRWFRAAVGVELGRADLVEQGVGLHHDVQAAMRPSFEILSVRMEMALGREEDVRESLSGLLDWLTSSPAGRQHLLVATLLAEVAGTAGERGQQQRLRDLLAPHGALFAASGAGSVACYGSVARFLGLLDAALGEWAAAGEQLAVAVAANHRAGAAPYTAHAQLALARVRARQGRAGEGVELARTARRTAQRLGMRALEAAAAALVADLDRQLPHLSARETEVAAMVARGLANRAIAEGLHLSVRTVENHVQRILDKLGYTSRAQVAAWAVANGLVSRREIE